MLSCVHSLLDVQSCVWHVRLHHQNSLQYFRHFSCHILVAVAFRSGQVFAGKEGQRHRKSVGRKGGGSATNEPVLCSMCTSACPCGMKHRGDHLQHCIGCPYPALANTLVLALPGYNLRMLPLLGSSQFYTPLGHIDLSRDRAVWQDSMWCKATRC